MGHGSRFLTRRAPLGDGRPDCSPTGTTNPSLFHRCYIWVRALRTWCFWNLLLCLVTEMGKIDEILVSSWADWVCGGLRGLMSAPLLLSDPSLSDRTDAALFYRAVRLCLGIRGKLSIFVLHLWVIYCRLHLVYSVCVHVIKVFDINLFFIVFNVQTVRCQTKLEINFCPN